MARKTRQPVGPQGIDAQPLSSVQWIPADQLEANDYNPNHVAASELVLLRDSILADGWTQPIVITPDKMIVDGFHRWTLGLNDNEVRTMTRGLVPCVTAQNTEPHHLVASTVRHNRARGTHGILLMSQLVQRLRDDQNVTPEDVGRLLGMEPEEVLRLYDRAGMAQNGKGAEYSKGWIPGRRTK